MWPSILTQKIIRAAVWIVNIVIVTTMKLFDCCCTVLHYTGRFSPREKPTTLRYIYTRFHRHVPTGFLHLITFELLHNVGYIRTTISNSYCIVIFNDVFNLVNLIFLLTNGQKFIIIFTVNYTSTVIPKPSSSTG